MVSRVVLDPAPDPLNTVLIRADREVTLHSDRVAPAQAGSGLLQNTVPIPAGPEVTHLSGTRTLAPAPALANSDPMSEEIRLSAQDLVPDPDLPNTVLIRADPGSEQLHPSR